MLFSPLAWTLLTFILMAVIPGALASSPKRSTRKATSTRVTVETYPAMEDGEITIPRHAAIPFTEALSLTPAPVSVPMGTKTPIEKFETIPAEKRVQVLRRMELCLSLIKETGRAYDYRVMTTAELEIELSAARQIKTADTGLSAE